MRLLPLSAFPLLAFLGLLDLGQARQGNKPRDKLQLRPKPKAQEVSPNIFNPLSHSLWTLFKAMPFRPFVASQLTQLMELCLTFVSHFSFLTFHFSLSISHVWFHTWSVVSVSLKTVIHATWTLIANLSKYQG